jgi:hypothetical protein
MRGCDAFKKFRRSRQIITRQPGFFWSPAFQQLQYKSMLQRQLLSFLGRPQPPSPSRRRALSQIDDKLGRHRLLWVIFVGWTLWGEVCR